jgi:hypothetical protein
MESETATGSGRGYRRFVAAGAAVVLSGSMLVAAVSGAGAKANFTRECFQGFGSRHIAHLNGPLVDLAETPSGRGCWLVGADGGVFTVGDAKFYGSAAGLRLVSPVVGFARTPSGRGYWLLAADGGVFNFGDAGYFGSAGGAVRANPMIAIRVSPAGNGYLLTDSAGKVYRFLGAAPVPPSIAIAATATKAAAHPHKAERKVSRKTVRKADRKAARKASRVLR